MPKMTSFQDYENLAQAIDVTEIKKRPGDATFKFYFIKKEDAENFFDWLQWQENLLGKEFIEKEIEVKSGLFNSPYSIITLTKRHYSHFCDDEKFQLMKCNLKAAAKENKPEKFCELIAALPPGVINHHLLSDSNTLSQILRYQTPENACLLIEKTDKDILSRNYEKGKKIFFIFDALLTMLFLFPLLSIHPALLYIRHYKEIYFPFLKLFRTINKDTFVTLLSKLDNKVLETIIFLISSEKKCQDHYTTLLAELLMDARLADPKNKDLLQKVCQLASHLNESIAEHCLKLWLTGKQPAQTKESIELIKTGIEAIRLKGVDEASDKIYGNFIDFLESPRLSLEVTQCVTLGDKQVIKLNDPELAKKILSYGLASYEDYHQLRAQTDLPKEIPWVLDALILDDVILSGKGKFYADLFFYALEQNSYDAAEQALDTVKRGNALVKIYRRARWLIGKRQLKDYQYRPVLRMGIFQLPVKIPMPWFSAKYDHLEDKIKPYSFVEKIKKKFHRNKKQYDCTKKTSATQLSPELLTPLFVTEDDVDNVGLLFDDRQCDSMAFLREDRGTIMKLWVGPLWRVKLYQKSMNAISYTDKDSFKKAILLQSHKCNEVLAALRREALLGIIISNYSAKSLRVAFERQQEIAEELKIKLPIFYYDQALRQMFVVNSPSCSSLLPKVKELYESLGDDKDSKEIKELLLAVIAMNDVDSFKYLLSYLPKEYLIQPIFDKKNTLLHEILNHLVSQPSAQAILMARILLNRDDVCIDIENEKGKTARSIVREHKIACGLNNKRLQDELPYSDVWPTRYQEQIGRRENMTRLLMAGYMLAAFPVLIELSLYLLSPAIVSNSFLVAIVPILGVSVASTLGIGLIIITGVCAAILLGYCLTLLIRKEIPQKYFNPLNLFKKKKPLGIARVFNAPNVRDALTTIKKKEEVSDKQEKLLTAFKEEPKSGYKFKRLVTFLLKNLSIDEITQKINEEFFIPGKQELGIDAKDGFSELKNDFQSRLDKFIVENKMDVHKWQTNMLRQRNIPDKNGLSEADVSAKEILRKVQRDIFKTEYRSGFFSGERVAFLDSQEKPVVKKTVPKEVKSALDCIEKSNTDEASSWSKTLEDVSQALRPR